MHIVRTIVWVLLLAALLVFSIANWDPPVTVRIWWGLVWDTTVPAVALLAFALGFVPLWLMHRTAKWQLKRRIAGLESALRAAALAVPAPENTANAELSATTPEAGPQ